MGVLTGAKPRSEVLKSDLQDAIFAADFGDLIDIEGRAPDVYKVPAVFFQNTHPASELCKVVRTVFERLADPKEPGATIRLSTGFGGGKTHTLMALWHLANNIQDLSLGTELLPAAGRPKSVTVTGVDAGKAGVPLFASYGATKVHSLWGDIFYKLGGEKALKSLGKADDPEGSPSEGQIEAVFPKGPVLLLLDELVIYMAKLSDRGQGNLLGFLNSLAAVVSKRPQSMLVVTDPARQAAYAPEAAAMATSLESAALQLAEVQSRKVSDFDPIGNEAARVIVRRLFERINPVAAQAASASYHSLYERLVQQDPNPAYKTVATAAYSKRIVESYPFHPRLLDTAQERLGAMQNFQKSRGVLRLFARIIRDAWERGDDLELITGGEIDWSSGRIQGDLLQRLQREGFRAAVGADIAKHAAELDGDEPRGVHARTASALLLESLPLQPNSGLDKADVTVAVLRPEEAGPEPGEALDRLIGVCWHTYPMEGGRGVQFRYEPNIIKQIEERMRDVPIDDARARVLSDAQMYFGGPAYKLVAWPDSAAQVSESADLQLALCETEAIAESVCNYSDDSNPQAPMPRKFRNSILAVAPAPAALNEAVARGQRLMAAEKIAQEHQSGEAGKLVREQLQRIRPELQKRFLTQTRRAFDRVFLAGRPGAKLEEKYQVSDEQILQQPQGQACIKKFLEEKDLVFQPGAALDVSLFLNKLLPGATPQPGKPDVYSARAVHERFLQAPGLRLMAGGLVVRQTILKALEQGKVVVRVPDGRAYDEQGCVDGPEGKRRRVAVNLHTFDLTDEVLMARAGTVAAEAWLKEDKGEPGGAPGPGDMPPPPPPPTDKSSATGWEQLLEGAATQPLLELRLTARAPAEAETLLALAQPLGAETLSLEVMAGGALREGGNMNFAAKGVKPTHPARPLATARTVFNSCVEGANFEVILRLGFGPAGRAGMVELLEQLRGAAPESVAVYGRFAQAAGAAL